jgi:hypothetical protein
MKRVPAFAPLLAFTALIALSAILAAQTAPASSPVLVFVHATVIDATGAAAQPDMTVVIKGGRISELGNSVSVPKNAQVVDATGKFLIPGLWDMHAHPHRPDDFALFIANGVTGIRVMAGLPWYHDAPLPDSRRQNDRPQNDDREPHDERTRRATGACAARRG